MAHRRPAIDDRLGLRASAYFRRDGGWIGRCTPYALPSDPRLLAATFRPLTVGVSATYQP